MHFFYAGPFRQGLEQQPGAAGCDDARLEAATKGSPPEAAGGTATCKTAKAESPAACKKIMEKNCNFFLGLESD